MIYNGVLTEDGEFDLNSWAMGSITDIGASEWTEAYAEIKKQAFSFLPSGVTVELRRRLDGSHGNFGATPGIAWYYEPGLGIDIFDSGWECLPNIKFSPGYLIMARLIVP